MGADGTVIRAFDLAVTEKMQKAYEAGMRAGHCFHACISFSRP